jgi:hypothetical protein
VALTIGDDSGSTSVIAEFEGEKEDD